jgi:UDP-glucuronate 4-epimerase
MIENKLILVTGAAGFIGFHLSKEALRLGAKVLGFDNLNEYYDVRLKLARLEILKRSGGFSFVKGDLADNAAVLSLFANRKPDIVINLAAQAGVRYSVENPRAYIDSNIVGFFNILEACRYNKIERMIYASSSSVYGNQSKIPFSISDNVDRPASLYAATKKSNELTAYAYSRLYEIPIVGLRFFTVYGPFGRPDMAYFSFAKNILNDKPIKVFNNGDMLRDFTYIDDVVIGIINLLSVAPEPYKIYNVGNNKPEKLTTLIEALETALGKKAQKEFLPMQPGDVYQTFADISESEKDFGFKPVTDIRTGIKKFAEWYKEYYGFR